MNYNISTKGSDTMTQTEQIKKLIAASDGMIQTSQVTDAGIAKAVLYQYVKENDMEQIAHGVYATQDSWTDAMYLVHLRCKQAVFSHETALFLHDLTDREPLEYEITVKTGYNPSRLKEDGIRVYTIKKELHEEGIIMMQTPFGHSVPVYNMERTICDIIRNRNNTEMQTFQNALKQYAKRKDKNLRLLMQYAGKFHVEKILRQYLEILL
jgi:predicted transcriptional regulator of viral defense system